MTPAVPGFDEWLSDELTKEAAIAGESVEKFIARAVVARMAVEQARRGDGDIDEMLERVRRMDLDLPPPTRDGTAGSVLADPERLQSLYKTGMLNPDRSRVLDRIVEMAVAALGVPSAAVTLVDHENVYIPSAIGVPDELAVARQIPLEHSMSRPIVSTGEAVITADARVHPALMTHPMVLRHYIVAFAGFPISDNLGHTIGALSVWDRKPREWSAGHLRTLEDFAEMAQDTMFSGRA
jgi:hypothetical protein